MKYWVIRASQYATPKDQGGEPPYEGCVPFMADGFKHVPVWFADRLPGEGIDYLLTWDCEPQDMGSYPGFTPEDLDFSKRVQPPAGGWPEARVVIADDRMDDF